VTTITWRPRRSGRCNFVREDAIYLFCGAHLIDPTPLRSTFQQDLPHALSGTAGLAAWDRGRLARREREAREASRTTQVHSPRSFRM